MVTRPPGLPAVVLKIGTLDDPSLFGGPKMAIYTVDKPAYHHIPEGMPSFERLPPRSELILVVPANAGEVEAR